MAHVIQVVGHADGTPCNMAGQYLETFNPNAHDGRGRATWTTTRSRAMQFTDVVEALRTYLQQSSTHPLREDGNPNRPLTAYNVTFE
jgi:hypothetical protein